MEPNCDGSGHAQKTSAKLSPRERALRLSREGVELRLGSESRLHLQLGHDGFSARINAGGQNWVRDVDGSIRAELTNGQCVILRESQGPYRHRLLVRVTLWCAARGLCLLGCLTIGAVIYFELTQPGRSFSVSLAGVGVAGVLTILGACAHRQSSVRVREDPIAVERNRQAD